MRLDVGALICVLIAAPLGCASNPRQPSDRGDDDAFGLELVDLAHVTRPGEPEPALHVADLGELELLSDEAERGLHEPPGRLHVGLRNSGLIDVTITGWVLRLDSGSKPVLLRTVPALIRRPHSERATVGPGEAVQLERPYDVEKGRIQALPLDLRPVELGEVSGAIELLHGAEVLAALPFRATVIPARDQTGE